MRGYQPTRHAFGPWLVAFLMLAATTASLARAADGVAQAGPPAEALPSAADTSGPIALARDYGLDTLIARVVTMGRGLAGWYGRTAPADRVIWGALTACAGLGILVILEGLFVLRRRRIMPRQFMARFLDRLHEGKLDCGQALDHCEFNPSPAARVALAAIRRWGRPAADLERAVALAHKVETERLRKNSGTLRRIAALAPLLGLLGTLFAIERALATASSNPVANQAVGSAWGPALASALSPLTAGIVIATLALVAYDVLSTRIETLAGALDRLGAETIDAIAMSAPVASPTITLGATATARSSWHTPNTSARAPHQPSVWRNQVAPASDPAVPPIPGSTFPSDHQ